MYTYINIKLQVHHQIQVSDGHCIYIADFGTQVTQITQISNGDNVQMGTTFGVLSVFRYYREVFMVIAWRQMR